MVEDNNVINLTASDIPFLEAFNQEARSYADTLGLQEPRLLTRAQLDNMFAYKTADERLRMAINQMVDQLVIKKGFELDTGQNSLNSPAIINQASEPTNGNNRGVARTKASAHFRSSGYDEAA